MSDSGVARPSSIDELRAVLRAVDPRDGVLLRATRPSPDPLAVSVVLDGIPGEVQARGASLQASARVSVSSVLTRAWRLGALPAHVPASASASCGSSIATAEPGRWGRLSDAIEGFELVTAEGEPRWVGRPGPGSRPEDDALFRAVPGSLGALGFVAWVRYPLVPLGPGPEPRVETMPTLVDDPARLVSELLDEDDLAPGASMARGWSGLRGPFVRLRSRLVPGDRPLDPSCLHAPGGMRRGALEWAAAGPAGDRAWQAVRWAWARRAAPFVDELRGFLFGPDVVGASPWGLAQRYALPLGGDDRAAPAARFLEDVVRALRDARLEGAWIEVARAPAEDFLLSPSRGADGISVQVHVRGATARRRARAELALRGLARRCADRGGRVRLTPDVLADRDVLQAMYGAARDPFLELKARVDPRGVLRAPVLDGIFRRPSPTVGVRAEPRDPTLAHAIARVGQRCPDRGFVFQDMEGHEHVVPYGELERRTAIRAGALQRLGLRRGDRLGLILPSPEDFVVTFLAAVRVGVVPVPLYPPTTFGSLDAHLDRTATILAQARARMVLTTSALATVSWSLVDRVPTLERVTALEALVETRERPSFPEIRPEDTAFLQFTSGSTAQPRGVVVTHAALMANCHAMIVDGVKRGYGDGVLVSWLPLYHDMGLVGFVLAAVAYGLTSVLIPTLRFVRRPSVWFDAIHEHRATMSCAPNFGYALVTKRARQEELGRWDLSSLRVLVCGAEPIHAETIRAFQALFTTRCRLDPSAFLPAYGMAESTLAISFKPYGTPWRARRVDAERFEREGVAVDAVPGRRAVEHVSCGTTFPGHELAVVGPRGDLLPDGVEGEIRLRGPSVAAGYFGDPAASERAFQGGWLCTGDLGYLCDGELFVTGRSKDLVIVRGRNLHPQSIEWRVAEVPGVRRGSVVAFGAPGPEGEVLVVAVESHARDKERVRMEVEASVRSELGVQPADVVVLSRGALPKTSSGKLRRRETRERYLAGTLGVELGRGGRRAVARHLLVSAWARLRSDRA